ncbi:MAG: DUF1028 domain-containing protein [Gemmatimonadota bacterium]|nr:DUF1028 domain-containing protein [Gemmatimonadota bacterium]
MKDCSPISVIPKPRWFHVRGTTFPAARVAVLAVFVLALPSLLRAPGASAQEPVQWGPDLEFHTFSIVGVDPETGEVGAAVTTRNACVGNGVPWVRVGVGAVATQASTRTQYGEELLDLIESGMSPEDALAEALAPDERAESRQIGVIALDGRSAQHTGSNPGAWAGQRAGLNYATQGNVLVGPEVLEAVATSFEATEGSHLHLADRLIAAMEAGQAAGGDRRRGRIQSAAVMVADPREGMARRDDGQTVHVNVCEHPEPVGEMRRIYDTISGKLGFRTLQQQAGSDVWQVKLIMHALGYYREDVDTLEREDGWRVYGDEIAAAVDAFRSDQGLSHPDSGGSPPGLVDEAAVELMWRELEAAGRAEEMRQLIRELTWVRR